MYATICRWFYWSAMSIDAYRTVLNFVRCGKERVRHKHAARYMKLLPAEHPLQHMSIDMLRPFTVTARNNFHLVVRRGLIRKMKQVAPILTIKALNVARAFFENWVLPYGHRSTSLPIEVVNLCPPFRICAN